MAGTEAYIVAATRTPVGRRNAGLGDHAGSSDRFSPKALTEIRTQPGCG
jgi:hypothetical protein